MRPKITFPEDDHAINLGHQRSLEALLLAIKEAFSSDAILYVEGKPAPKVETFLESAAIEPDVDIARGTGWPKPKFFHVPLTAENLAALLEFTANHAESEICEHVVVYAGDQFLLWAHDALDGEVHVSPSLGAEALERLHEVVSQSTPSRKLAKNEMLFIMSQLKVAQRKLREKYASRVAERGGELGVQIARASYPRHRIKTVGLDADVTWEDTRIYDHRHGEVLTRRWFSSHWEKRRSVDEAVGLIEDQIQEWIETGGPFLAEPVSDRSLRSAANALETGESIGHSQRGSALTEQVSDTQPTTVEPETEYAPVNGLQMYYEIHGSGGVPLLLLHGGLFNIDLQFGQVLPGLAKTRQVIAVDFQAHGRTGDIDRPLTSAGLASDVVGLLQHLGVPQVDVFGFSVGGAVTLYLAIKHPELVRKVIVSSASFHPDGDRTENAEAVGEMTVDMIAGTPMEQEYLAKSPNPDKLQDLLDKLGAFDKGFTGWSDDEIKGIAAPTLLTVGDCDAVSLEHAVRFLQLRGGDVNGDFVGVPSSQLAVFPGTTHFFGMARTELVLEVVTTFLDPPETTS